MEKKLLILFMALMVILSMSTTVFADSGGGIPEISPFNSHEVIVKEFQNTTNGTEYGNKDGESRKVVWTEDFYKVYYKDISSGRERFAYDLYEWEWKGYAYRNTNWVHLASKSGSNRTHVNAFDIGSFLMSF